MNILLEGTARSAVEVQPSLSFVHSFNIPTISLASHNGVFLLVDFPVVHQNRMAQVTSTMSVFCAMFGRNTTRCTFLKFPKSNKTGDLQPNEGLVNMDSLYALLVREYCRPSVVRFENLQSGLIWPLPWRSSVNKP